MSYFVKENSQEDLSQDESSLEYIYSEVCDICLKNLMLSSDAYVCMTKLNMKGYKRLHRHLSKKFYEIYLELQSDIIDKFGKINKPNISFDTYKIKTLEEHLQSWNNSIEDDLIDIGNLIKEMFDVDGFIHPLLRKLQQMLYKSKIKNEHAIKQLTDCEWSFESIYNLDNHLNKKFKLKEAR